MVPVIEGILETEKLLWTLPYFKFPEDDSFPRSLVKNNSKSPDEIEKGDGWENNEPEPEKNVNLFVDYVDWQYALKKIECFDTHL